MSKVFFNNMVVSPGQILAGRYRLVRVAGGEAAFLRWVAQDLELDNVEVELAFMPPEVSGSGRTMAEVRAAAAESLKLLHDGIASARAFVDMETIPFFVFDHVDGRPLPQCLDEWGRLGEAEAKAMLAPIASALDYAHEKGIVHGDLRPSNIVVDEEAVPTIVGFCVSGAVREALARTRGGAAAGAVSWMSPEQLMGEAPTAAQDIYSFAAIAYESMAGHPPFYRGQVEYQVMHGAAEPLEPETPFTRAVMRALSKNPAERPATCAELMAGDMPQVEMPEVVSAVAVKVSKARKPSAPQGQGRAAGEGAAPAQERPAPIRVLPGVIPPPGAVPPGAFPPDGLPPGVMPPPGAMPPGAQQRHRQQRTPPVPVKARRKVPTPEEIEARKKRLDAVEHRRRRQREAYERLEIADAAFKEEQARAAARKALWALAGIVVIAVVVILFASLGGKTNIELANAPVRKTFTAEELGRFSQFQGIEFGRVIAEMPKEGDPIVFGTTTNTVGKVGLDGRIFEVELAEPIYKVFPQVRITLVDTEGGRRISGLTFERNGEVIKAARAKKVVSKIASHIEQEYGIDMGDTQTTINDAYFGQRYSDDFIDIRISSVVAPDSTSISFSIESRAVRAMEIVVAR